MARRPPISLIPSLPAPAEPKPAPVTQQPQGWRKSSTREGRRAVAFWVDRADYQELQVATARMETTIQADCLGIAKQPGPQRRRGAHFGPELLRRHAQRSPHMLDGDVHVAGVDAQDQRRRN